MEADSTNNYDLGIGTVSLASLVPLVKAQLFTAEGRYGEAILLYSQTLDKENIDNLKRREVCFFADRAWCHLRLGQLDAALSDARAAEAAVHESCDIDDLASAHSRIYRTLEELGRAEEAAQYKDASLRNLDQHSKAQENLLGLLLASYPEGKRVITPR
jgi:tetratricopeptide (TPR) repeat protein